MDKIDIDLTQLDCAADDGLTAAMANGRECVVCGDPPADPREVGRDCDTGAPVFACAECCGESDEETECSFCNYAPCRVHACEDGAR